MSEELENDTAKKVVLPEGPLKEMLVNYVGQKLQPENDEVTVEMLVTAIAEEFPEFVLVVAEENFIRGYKQALEDMDKFNSLQGTEPQG